MRKLNTNKTQILHRIRLRKYNPEKLPEDNYQEAQWQIDDNIVVPQDDLYTLAWKAEIGGHLFDIPIIYTDPNAINFDESHGRGPDNVFVPSSIFMIQAMVKTGKLVPPLTQLYYILQILNRIVKVRTLRPRQTQLTLIIPNKHPNQVRTLKLHVNLCHNHHQGRVTTLQHLRSMTLLPNLFRKLNLVLLEAANTTYALILILITQKCTDIDVCKTLFQPLFVCPSHFLIFSHTHHSTFACFFPIFWGKFIYILINNN